MRAWWFSLRPRTLPLAALGILAGHALAYAFYSAWDARIFCFSFLTALSLQILANFANDYGDAEKSADTPCRAGPLRGMQQGLISPAAMRTALAAIVLITLILGSLLIASACAVVTDALVFFVLGALSLLAALFYTVGRYAYGYRGLGDLSVLVFFGWLSVCGSFYLQTHVFDWRMFLPATACGLLSVLVLNANNLRDFEEDRNAGKNTLAVKLGFARARKYFAALVYASFLCLMAFAWIARADRPGVWLFLAALPFFWENAAAARRLTTPEAFRPRLAAALKLNLVALGSLIAGLFLSEFWSFGTIPF